MQDWSEGYVTDISYTYGYYGELNPVRARLALLAAGLVPPRVEHACELGFGQGISINLHAAGAAAVWHGTDFNSAQTGFARDLAGGGLAAARLVDEAFETFCRRDDLPDFDFIGLHGIWSWVSAANRAVLADFLRRKLRVGGVAYVSYNSQPGASVMAPMRDLLAGYADALTPSGMGTIARVDAALDFADRLLATDPLFSRFNPVHAEQLKKLRTMDRQYLAHEYFNLHWAPVPFARMAETMGAQKLQFACSANYLDHVPALHLTQPQQKLLADVPDPVFRETVHDLMVNQRFRRDYWVRGARRLGGAAHAELVRAQRVVLATRSDQVALDVTGALGKAVLHEAVYRPVLDHLGDLKVHTLGEIERAVAGQGIDLQQVLQAVLVLCAKGAAHPAQEAADSERAMAACAQLNARVCRMATQGAELHWLASPVTGGGYGVSRIDQLFLQARGQGAQTAEDYVRHAATTLGLPARHAGPDPADASAHAPQLAALRNQAEEFMRQRLPLLEALGIAISAGVKP